jgi:hypothetical protein
MAYTAPTSDDLKERYPAFATVGNDTVDVWLAEAAEECANWPDDARARAEMAYAAHRMVETGSLASAVPQGLTSFRSGDFSASVSDSVASRSGFATTVYGQEFLRLQRRYFGGPRLAWTPPAQTDA